MNLLWKDMNPYYYQHCLVRCCRNLAEKVACFPRKCWVSESEVAVRGSQEIKKHKGKDYLSTGERAISAYQEYLNHWLSLLVMRKTIFHCQDTKSHWLQKEITCAVKHKCTEMTRCRTATQRSLKPTEVATWFFNFLFIYVMTTVSFKSLRHSHMPPIRPMKETSWELCAFTAAAGTAEGCVKPKDGWPL